MIQTEYRLVSVGVSVGPADVPSKTCKNKVQAWCKMKNIATILHMHSTS